MSEEQEMILVISERLRNEFPGEDRNYYEVAARLYRIMILRQPDEEIETAQRIIKSALKRIGET